MDDALNNFEKVWNVVRRIPRGRVTTYGAIADFLLLRSARMVGWALHSTAVMTEIPAHRVVNRKGILTGKNQFPTPDWMEQALLHEGVEVERDQVVDFKSKFIHPSEYME